MAGLDYGVEVGQEPGNLVASSQIASRQREHSYSLSLNDREFVSYALDVRVGSQDRPAVAPSIGEPDGVRQRFLFGAINLEQGVYGESPGTDGVGYLISSQAAVDEELGWHRLSHCSYGNPHGVLDIVDWHIEVPSDLCQPVAGSPA